MKSTIILLLKCGKWFKIFMYSSNSVQIITNFGTHILIPHTKVTWKTLCEIVIIHEHSPSNHVIFFNFNYKYNIYSYLYLFLISNQHLCSEVRAYKHTSKGWPYSQVSNPILQYGSPIGCALHTVDCSRFLDSVICTLEYCFCTVYESVLQT